jgi:hypothetical protein
LKWIQNKLGGRWTGRKEAEKTEEEHREKKSEWSTTTLKEHFLSSAQPRNYTTDKGLISRTIIHIRFYPLG